jgi:excisionase family DNA binding protein
MFTTGEAARALGVSVKTLLAWTERGLLHPVRTTAGWRKFSDKDLQRLKRARQKRQAPAESRPDVRG